VRFLITLNMPAFEGRLVHQVTLDVPEANSLKELCLLMNRDEFIIGRHWYRRKNMYTNESEWQDRKDVILNTAHIGKVVEFIDMDEEYYDDSQKGATVVRSSSQSLRKPIRP
jgi:hypothetical protein